MKYGCDEVGNMERFVDQHSNSVRFIKERNSWAYWDETRWRLGASSDVFQLAIDTVKSIFDEARDCTNAEGQKRLGQWAIQCQSNRRIKSMTQMASESPELNASVLEFDSDPMVINCLNGMVDLKTGELVGRTPDDKVMKLAPVEYARHARCPRFDKFLHDVFNNDRELISWLQRAIGYTLTGLVDEQAFFIAYGTGANGKSTLFEVLLDIMGDYGKAAEFDTFLDTDRSNVRVLESIAKLQGVRFALASETDSTRRFSEAIVKKITGGDTVTGSQLYGKSFEFQPEFKLWLLANHLPVAKDGSHGFWRRVRVVPFARKFSKQEMDQSLKQKLLEEREGIFAWAVRGAMSWLKNTRMNHGQSGIGSCSAVDQATALYRSDNDLFSQFIDDCLLLEVGPTTRASDLYEAYLNWCELKGDQSPCSQTIFGSRLQERDVTKSRDRSGIVYRNVSLKRPEELRSDF